jgi:hypothetical protein
LDKILISVLILFQGKFPSHEANYDLGLDFRLDFISGEILTPSHVKGQNYDLSLDFHLDFEKIVVNLIFLFKNYSNFSNKPK